MDLPDFGPGPETIQAAKRLRANGMGVRAIARELGKSPSTISVALRTPITSEWASELEQPPIDAGVRGAGVVSEHEREGTPEPERPPLPPRTGVQGAPTGHATELIECGRHKEGMPGMFGARCREQYSNDLRQDSAYVRCPACGRASEYTCTECGEAFAMNPGHAVADLQSCPKCEVPFQ